MNKRTHLNLKMIIGLAAPHTWAASIMPVLLTGAYVYRQQGSLPPFIFLALLVISILMQSAVNTLNDYFDLKNGTDSTEDAVEASDAVLLYNDIAPMEALLLGLVFLALAGLFSIGPVMSGGISVLLIGIIGAIAVLLYSAGPVPLSHLPFGECISGFVMGSLIPLACYGALMGATRFVVILHTLPVAYAIGMIMLTNNTCDIEKDMLVNRRTLPVILGREKAVQFYKVMMYVWAILQELYLMHFLPPVSEWNGKRLVFVILSQALFLVRLYATVLQIRDIDDKNNRPTLMKRAGKMTYLTGFSLLCAYLCK